MHPILLALLLGRTAAVTFMSKVGRPIILLLGILCCPVIASAQFKFLVVKREVVQQRLQAYKGNDRDREATLKALFQSAGCAADRLIEQPVKGLNEPNLVCTLPGKTDSVILVGAHYDHADRGEGVADNWSGASLLPSFYESLRSEHPQKTFVFVGFAGEEKGLVGSRFYVKQLSKLDLAKIQVMVCIDTLGLSTTEVWVSRSNKQLVSALNGVAHGLELPLTGVNVDFVGMSDEEPFVDKKVPVVVIHSVTQGTLSVLHTPRDNYKAINFDDYYDSYRLLSGYLELLDQVGDLKPVQSK